MLNKVAFMCSGCDLNYSSHKEPEPPPTNQLPRGKSWTDAKPQSSDYKMIKDFQIDTSAAR
jgi:rubredoxin